MSALSVWFGGSVSGDDGLPDFPGTHGVPCFPPHCKDTPRCSHHGDASQGSFEIVDFLRIPPELLAGEYVLGWRWDCEQVMSYMYSHRRLALTPASC